MESLISRILFPSHHSAIILQAQPGFILSVRLLHEIGEYIHECLDMSYSHRYDLELGRCINKFIGIDCIDQDENRYEAIPIMNIEKGKHSSKPIKV